MRSFAAAVLVVALGFPAMAEDIWPQWRGPNRDAKVGGKEWPNTLGDSNITQLWRKPLGSSYSSPIVSKDRVFVTETRNKSDEIVRALDRKTGEQIWEVKWPAAMTVPPFAAANGSWIRATPAYDGENLYVASMLDILVCLNATDGKEIWRMDFAKTQGTKQPAFGNVASPMVIGDFVYTQSGGGLVKIQKDTGELVWKVLDNGNALMSGGAFSSPVQATIAGREMLLVQTRTTLVGVDADSGKELWSQDVPAFRGMNILTPTVSKDTVFTSTYQGGSFLFGIESSGSGMSVTQLWKNKVQAYMSSPVVIKGHAYLHLRNKNIVCLDLTTGEQKWITKKYGAYMSMVAQGDQILGLDADGQLILFEANPTEFKLIGSKKVSNESTWAHIAICDDEIYVRELNAIAAYRWSNPKAAATRPATTIR